MAFDLFFAGGQAGECEQYLIDNGNDANSIVAITYTNAAAIEMRRRLKNCENVFIGTIHSYCNQILVKYGINTNDILDKE